MTEEWRPIVGYEKYYEVSNFGRIRSLDRVIRRKTSVLNEKRTGRVLRPGDNGKGYLLIHLSVGGKTTRKYMHRAVGVAFLKKESSLQNQINHKDGNKANNFVKNLEWITASGNQNHAFATGLASTGNGYKCRTRKEVFEIRELHKTGLTFVEIAKKYKMDPTNVSKIIKKRSFKNI